MANANLEHLTVRQRQVLRLVAEGLTYNEIGLRLGLAEGTVKVLLSQAYKRLGTSSAIESLRAVGWVVPTEPAA